MVSCMLIDGLRSLYALYAVNPLQLSAGLYTIKPLFRLSPSASATKTTNAKTLAAVAGRIATR